MATIKQEIAAKVVVSGGTPTEGMRAANYSEHTIRNPYKLTRTQGFRDVLKEYGLTQELITTSLVDDIKAKPQKRVPELTLGAEILGMKKQDEQAGDRILILNISETIAKKNGLQLIENEPASSAEPNSGEQPQI